MVNVIVYVISVHKQKNPFSYSIDTYSAYPCYLQTIFLIHVVHPSRNSYLLDSAKLICILYTAIDNFMVPVKIISSVYDDNLKAWF